MSDSESDDEFLSADEGEMEDGKAPIEEEEVDELMDLLMNKGNKEKEPNIVENTNQVKKKDLESTVDVTTTEEVLKIPKEPENAAAEFTEEEESLEDIVEKEYQLDNSGQSKETFDVPDSNRNDENELEVLPETNDRISPSMKCELDRGLNTLITANTSSEKDNTEKESIEILSNQDIDTNEECVNNDLTFDSGITLDGSKATIETPEKDNIEIEEEDSEKENSEVLSQNESANKNEIPADLETDNTQELNDTKTKEKEEEVESQKINIPSLPDEDHEDVGESLADLDLDDDDDDDNDVNSSGDKNENIEIIKVTIVESTAKSEEGSEQQHNILPSLNSEDIEERDEEMDVEKHETIHVHECDGDKENKYIQPLEMKKDDNLEKESEDKESNKTEDQQGENGDWGDWTNEDDGDQSDTKKVPCVAEGDETIVEKAAPASETVNTVSKTNVSTKDDWGWDSWADDFIVQAAGKVSTLLENVEGQLGIPDPSKMAAVVTKEEKDEHLTQGDAKLTNKGPKLSEPKPDPPSESKQNSANQSTGVSSWFSGFGSVGTDLVTGSIGALEFIGKKTVDILSDGDPGLRQKRDALVGKKTNTLAATLREAKLNAEKTPSTPKQKPQTPEDVKFNDLFDKFQGNAHLDALEMLSNECETKLERILNIQSDSAKEETMKLLSETREHFELMEDENEREENGDFKKELFAATKRLKMKVTCSKLLNTWLKLKEKSKGSLNIENPKECFDTALSCLAELTSRYVEFHRKVADMLLVMDMQAKELSIQRSSTLKSITEMFMLEITSITNNFAHQLADGDSAALKIVTDIYIEGSNCTSLLKDCHELLLPILQCCIIK